MHPWFEDYEVDDNAITFHNYERIAPNEVGRSWLCVGYRASQKDQLESAQHIDERVECAAIKVHRVHGSSSGEDVEATRFQCGLLQKLGSRSLFYRRPTDDRLMGLNVISDNAA